MKSLLQMSEQELAQQEAGHSFRLCSATGLSVIAAVLALLGMVSRYAPGDQAPLPGMDHLAGQCDRETVAASSCESHVRDGTCCQRRLLLG